MQHGRIVSRISCLLYLIAPVSIVRHLVFRRVVETERVLVPAGSPGQTFAVLEMLIGQLFLVTAMAKVVSVWRPRRDREGPRRDAGEE
ncbi:MAG: hypothetical protein ACLPUO_26195 [Streptosporangiaceae bacterium]